MPFRPNIVIVLILINVFMYYASFSLSMMGETLPLYFPLNESFSAWQMITHMFMHAGLVHLLFNMFGLLIFGIVLDRAWGTRNFLLFYFACGMGAAAIYLATQYWHFHQLTRLLADAGIDAQTISGLLKDNLYPPSILTEQQAQKLYSVYFYPMLGASGALYGVLAAFAIMFPDYKLYFLFIPFPIRARYLVPVLVTGDLVLGLTGYSLFGVGIAHFAHVGGALTGAILTLIFFRKNMTACWEK